MEIIRDNEKTPHYVLWNLEAIDGECVEYFETPEKAITYYDENKTNEGDYRLFINNKQVIGLNSISEGKLVLDTGSRTWEEYKGEVVTSKLEL